MRNFNENTITDAVLERLSFATSPRTREISEALVRHLHAFVREVRPTQEEWMAGIEFLTRTGQMCSATRQEFILLSDTLGVSMLVDAINHARAEVATETTVLGPFYLSGPPEMPLGTDISTSGKGDPMIVEGTVRDSSGAPVAGAWIDTWQADADGVYDVQRGGGNETPALDLRARFRTDAEGRFWFRSITPCYYPVPDDGPVGEMLKAQGRHANRPAHAHFMIGAPGFETLVTHLFIADSPYIDSDAVFGVKDSLVCQLEKQAPGLTPAGNCAEQHSALLRYDFVLAANRQSA
jgi:hydroxyquinol 1,2-dioxygenase